MITNENYHPVVAELVDLIHKNKWESKFEDVVKKIQGENIADLKDIKTVNDWLKWLNDWLFWVPKENETGTQIYKYLTKFSYFFDLEPLLDLQNKEIPHDEMPKLTPLSAWIVKYAKALGEFLDTPESLTPESEKTFYDSPTFNMSEYARPRGGWKTFNQIFARRTKPGRRPIAAIDDQSVIVYPTDCTFSGQWEIREDSHVNIKGLDWRVMELLEGSPYKDRFVGGHFTHAFLNTFDYHRQHAPVAGKVLEARVINGAVYVEVISVPVTDDPNAPKELKLQRRLDAPDSAGFEFMQTRGLIVLDTPIGLVAVLPIGMSHVSSVIITAEVGQTLRKGEELSYFQFGGSDVVMVFEAASNVNITSHPGVHYKMGTKFGDAYPVYKK